MSATMSAIDTPGAWLPCPIASCADNPAAGAA